MNVPRNILKSDLLALRTCMTRKCKAPFQANSVLSGVVLFIAVEHFLRGNAVALAEACLQILQPASMCERSNDGRSHVPNMMLI